MPFLQHCPYRHKIRHLKEKVGRLGKHNTLVKAVLAAYCQPEKFYTTQFVNCSDQRELEMVDKVNRTENKSMESLSLAHPVMLLMGSGITHAGESTKGNSVNSQLINALLIITSRQLSWSLCFSVKIALIRL
jgi:hypothetical protein